MLEVLKRKALRSKLKRQKISILADLMEVNRKLKILDQLDDKEKKDD